MMPVSSFKKTSILVLSALWLSSAAFFMAPLAAAQEAQPPAQAEPSPSGTLPPQVTQAIENLGPGPDAPVPAAAPEEFPVMPAAQPAPPPSQDALQSAASPPATDASTGTAAIPLIPGAPTTNTAATADVPAEDLFYDANDIVTQPSPTGAQQSSTSPRKLDPATEPASTLIIVTKDRGKNSTDARLISADRALKLGRYDSALEIYDALYEKNKKNVSVLMGRAVALQKLGRDEEAIVTYEQISRVDPGNVDAQINMLGIMGQRYPSVALKKLTDLQADHPDHVGVLAQLAVVEAQSGNYREGLKYLGMAASLEPRNPMHLMNMAVIADRAGDHDQAIALYEQALEVDSIYQGGRLLPRDSVFERLAALR